MSGRRPTGAGFSPRVLVGDRVLSSSCRLSKNARLTALALAHFLGPEDRGAGWVCFYSLKELKKRTGLSVASLSRAMRELASGPQPLFERRVGASWQRRGPISARVAVMRLILDPTAYRQAHPEAPARPRRKPAAVALKPEDQATQPIPAVPRSAPRVDSRPVPLAAEPVRPAGLGALAGWIEEIRRHTEMPSNVAQGEQQTLGRKHVEPAA